MGFLLAGKQESSPHLIESEIIATEGLEVEE